MEALLSCSRNSISCRKATLYCTTFPCHNCAKHIIAAGISTVIYIEPYPKSKTFEFYNDSITNEAEEISEKVKFIPFTGIGPRKYFDLFSMSLSSGYEIKRKNNLGKVVKWEAKDSKIRLQMTPYTYLDKETLANELYEELKRKYNDEIE